MNTMPENTQTVYAGLDIAKATLQLHLHGRQAVLPNTAAGHARLCQLLRPIAAIHVVCEATGGYERAVVARLHAAELPVSIVNPARVRHFAQAQGRRAKNDPLDAATLTAFGQALQPQPTPVPHAVLTEWRDLIRWRQHLKEQLIATSNRSEHALTKFVCRRQASLCKQLTAQITAVEAELAAALKRSPQWAAQIQKLTQIDGVGTLTAVATLSQMPELGR